MMNMLTQNKLPFSHFKHEVILIGLISIVFILRVSSFSLPFFWDEAGTYSRGIFYLAKNGVGILPGDLDPEISRGHPMLFVFICSLWYKFLYSSVFGLHLLMAFTSSLTVISIYFLTIRVIHGNKTTALLSSLLLLVSPLFQGLYCLVLPEMMLTLFSVLSLIFWIDRKVFLYFICASATILTKETGIIIPATIFVYELIINQKKGLKTALVGFTPIILFIIFIVIQRIQNGWFLLPFHTSFIDFTFNSIWDKFHHFIEFIFIKQGRVFISILLVLGLFWAKKKIFTNEWILLFLYFVAGLAFCSINFFMIRYIFFIFPVFCILALTIVQQLLKKSKYFFPIILLCILIQVFYMKSDKFKYDTNLSYLDTVEVMTDASSFLKDNFSNEISFFCADPFHYFFTDTRYEIIDNKWANMNKSSKPNLIISCQPGIPLPQDPLSNGYQEIKRFSKGFSEVKIYQIK
jgi:hypothetical protein